jgi:hypothetical protein
MSLKKYKCCECCTRWDHAGNFEHYMPCDKHQLVPNITPDEPVIITEAEIRAKVALEIRAMYPWDDATGEFIAKYNEACARVAEGRP